MAALLDFDRLLAIFSSRSPETSDAFRHPHNHSRLLGAASRSAPSTSRADAQLTLSLAEYPKLVPRGFVFGSNPSFADVLIGDDMQGVSGVHFTIQLYPKDTYRNACDRYAIHANVPEERARLAETGKQITWASPNQLAYDHTVSIGTQGHTPIYQAWSIATPNRLYAVKVFLDSSEALVEKHRSSYWLSTHRHPNIINEFWGCKINNFARDYMVMEWAEYGSLNGHLSRVFELSPYQMIMAFEQILVAVTHLHGHDMAYQNIKPTNVLVRSLKPLRIQLADFDTSPLDRNGWRAPPITCYSAPEMSRLLNDQGTTTFALTKLDIWSIGVMMLQFGGYPGLSEEEQSGSQWHHSLHSRARDLAPIGLHKPLLAVAQHLIVLDPKDRPPAGIARSMFRKYTIELLESFFLQSDGQAWVELHPFMKFFGFPNITTTTISPVCRHKTGAGWEVYIPLAEAWTATRELVPEKERLLRSIFARHGADMSTEVATRNQCRAASELATENQGDVSAGVATNDEGDDSDEFTTNDEGDVSMEAS